MSLDYRSFHLNLLSHTYNNLLQNAPFNLADMSTQDEEFLQGMNALIDLGHAGAPEFFEQGQILLCTLVRNYPDLVPLVARDLFWYLGGECLHHMPDEEIEKFQRLEEMRYEAESEGREFNYEKERALILGYH